MTEPVTPETPTPTPSRRSALVGLAATVAVVAALLVAGVRAGGSAPSGGAASPEGSSSAPAAAPSSGAGEQQPSPSPTPTPAPTATPFVPPTLSAPSGPTAAQEVPLDAVGEVLYVDVPRRMGLSEAEFVEWAAHQAAWLCGVSTGTHPTAEIVYGRNDGLIAVNLPAVRPLAEGITPAERGWHGALSQLRVERTGAPSLQVLVDDSGRDRPHQASVEFALTTDCH